MIKMIQNWHSDPRVTYIDPTHLPLPLPASPSP